MLAAAVAYFSGLWNYLLFHFALKMYDYFIVKINGNNKI